MKTFTKFAIATGAALTLAACGSSDDASAEAEADTVEMPADEAMADVTAEPVAQPTDTAPSPVVITTSDEAEVTEREQAQAQQAADNARAVAREAMEAAEAAEAAARSME